MKKRFLALLMAVVMIFQITVITPYSAFAEVTETNISADVQNDGTDVPVLRAESGLTVLAFTSDTHNQSNNTAANRLGTWLDKITGIYGKKPDAMAFGGDMADASASSTTFWTYTQADMDQLDSRSVTGVYTTGNHEHSPGNYSASSTNATQKAYKINAEGAVGTNYIIYCLGSTSSSQSYSNSVSVLSSYLNSVGNDKPIFIITHFPLHYYSSSGSSGWSWGGRSTDNASDIIDVLNNAAASGKKIVFLWGHNHTLSDTYYDGIYAPGYELEYASGSKKAIQFYYGGAGCMSDQEYGSGSASVKGKGLVVTINSKNQLSFTYYDANGNDVTEGGTFTEQDPVAATAINIEPSSVTVMARKTTKLSVVFTPSDATNQGITWSSANESIATVDANGTVRGVAPGNTTITAVSTNGNVSATCQVTVTENTSTGTTYILADRIEEGGDYLIVSSKADGTAYALRNPGATSGGASLAAAQVTVSGETIETEDEDIIWTAETRLSGYALKNGEDAILAGKGGTAYIYTVSSDPYADRYWNYDGTYLLYQGGSYTYELYYANGTFTDNSFNSGNPSHPVYIFERVSAPAPVSGVTLDKSTLNIKIGKTGTLTATVLPRNAQNKSVTWSSSNTSVATVSNGVVTGVSKGTATITVTTAEGGYTATCNVNVSEVTGTTYVLTETLEDGKEYLIVNGKTGSVYVLSNEAGSSVRQLKGISAEVEGDSITLEDEIAEKVEFTAELKTSTSGAVSAWLKNGGKYLYTNNNDGLRMVESSEQGNSDNSGKFWHYKGDGKNLLWYFKDTSSQDGYTDTSQTYKYYLSVSNGVFTDNHVSTTSLGNTNTPAIYLFVKDDSTPAPVSGVTLDKSTLNLKIGKTGTLTATVLPRNAQNKSVTWSSSNTSVATVSDGVVTGVSKGTATITVRTADGGYTATCNVNVSEVTGTTYVLTETLEDGKEYLIVNGKTGSVYVLSNEAGGSRQLKGISAEVEGDSITLEDEIAEKAEFTAELKTSSSGAISAWLKNGGKYLYTNSADGLRMVESSEQGNSDNTAKVWHYKGDGKNLLWYFKDTSSQDGYTDTSQTYKYYLECSNGVFTDNHVSTTSLSNTNTPAIYLFVKDDSTPAPVSGVTLDKSTLNIKIGKTGTLTATVLPRNAQNKSVTWSSSKPSVATVSDGVVTGVTEGYAVITVTTADGGYTATCNVTVSEMNGTTYVLTDRIEDGGEYLIVSSKADGTAYALRNPGATSGGASLAATQVTVSGETIETEAEDIIWAASPRLSGFALKNGEDAILAGKGGTAYIYTVSSDPYADRYWNYDGTYLLYQGGSYTYELYYANGSFTDNSFNSGNPSHPVYIFERVSTPAHEHTYGEPDWIWHIPETGTKATRAVEGVTATAVFTCTECGAKLEIEADSDSITKTVDAATGDTIYTASVKGPDGIQHSGETTVKAEVEKKYKITITADKTMVSADDDEVTFTLSLGPADYFGFFQMSIKIEPEDAGLTYIENSFEIADGLQDTLGFDVVGWSETYLRLNGYASEADYSSEDEIILGTFRCAIGDGFTGSARVTIDTNTFEVYSCDDFSYHSPEYEIVSAEITNHEHVNGEATYEWTGNDEDGYTSVKGSITCTVCDAEVVAEEVVPAFEVTTAATCTTEGSGVWTATFTKEGLEEQTKEVVIPIGGHDWKFVRFTWTKTDNGYTVVANYECKNDDTHTDTVEASVTVETTPATCEEAGESVYTATVSEEASLDGKDHEGSRTVEIPATGHDWDDPTYVWADNNSSVTATRICNNDESHTETETVNATSEDTTPATCTTAGVKTWTSAAFTNTAFTVQTTTEEIPATGHDWKFVDVDWTETESGFTAVANYECKNDEEHKQTADMTVTGEEGAGSDAGYIVYTATLEEADSPDGQEHTAVKRDAIEYQIGYVLDGGSNPAEAPVSYTIDSDPVTLPIPSKEGYGFGGWFETEDLSGDAVTAIATGSTGDKTFYAKWVANACTITWKLYDDNVSSTVESYGTAWADVVKPEDPTREGYTFAGWTGNPETITADVEITATWTVNQYTITFDTDGGSEVAAITADYGTEITVPADPTKEGFIFKGWNPAIPETMPAENMTIKATWTVDEFTLTFDTDGGSTVAPITAAYGAAITAPADPTREGYTFKGWSPAIPETMPAENMTVKATWEINQYTITFNTDGGSAVAAITADYGAVITAPAAPTKTGYTFKAWSPAIPETMPAENITVKATWTVNKYTITFDTDGGSEVAPITANYGAAVTAPADPTREGYTFKGWDQTIPATMPAENITIKATWKVNKYTITFDTDGGSEVATITAEYGAKITAPAAPTKTGYTFKSWSPAIPATMPAENMTIKATWKVNKYTITFNTDGGSEVASITANYGAKITAPADPTKEGYTFKSWSPAIPKTMPAENMTIKATWTINKYTVTWTNDDGTVLETDKKVSYGTVPTYDGETPTKAATAKYTYTFKSWSPKVTAVKADTTYTATYSKTINQYTVKFVDHDGTVLKKATKYDYGTKWADVAKPADPTREGYVFAGWTGYTNTVTKNVTVKATYKAISYVMSNNITFEGALTFNAYTVISDDVLADDGAYMLITYTTAPTPASAKVVTDKVLIKNAKTSTKDGVTRRIFTIPFFIAQLNDEVTMKLYSSDGKEMPIGRLVSGEIVDMTKTGVVDTPWAYLNRIIDNPNSNPTMVELAKQSKIYGTAAQLHFNYHTELLPAGATTELEKAVAGTSIATALSKYTETTTGTLPAGIERYTKQIVFEADHSLKYFIYLDGTVDVSKYTFEVDDGNGNFKKVTPVKVADGKYSIQKENIPSGYLSKTYKYRISDGTNTFVITSSGLAYANSIVTKNANPTMVTLVKAMYLYSVAAEKHFKISN